MNPELLGSLPEHAFGDIPAEAGVGDADTVAQFSQIWPDRLVAFEQVTFQHDAEDRFTAFDQLQDQILPDIFLAGMLFSGIGVTAIHHDTIGKARLGQQRRRVRNTDGIIIGTAVAPTQDHVAIRISLCFNDGHCSLLVNSQEMMGMTR